MHTGIILNFDEIRWDIRPRPGLAHWRCKHQDSSSNAAKLEQSPRLFTAWLNTVHAFLIKAKNFHHLPWFLAENKWACGALRMDVF